MSTVKKTKRKPKAKPYAAADLEVAGFEPVPSTVEMDPETPAAETPRGQSPPSDWHQHLPPFLRVISEPVTAAGNAPMVLAMCETRHLRAWAANPRRNEEAARRLGPLLDHHGYRVPAILDQHGTIAAGHTRRIAALARGIKEVAVLVQWFASEAARAAFAIADNQAATWADWDLPLLKEVVTEIDTGELELDKLVGFSEVEFGELFNETAAVSAEPQGQDIEEEDEAPIAGLPPIPDEAAKAPFPWFGGKRRVAGVIWQAFGDVALYVEPFAGSLATLLARPAEHEYDIATVNDMDAFVANFWRAMKDDPVAVAEAADGPVNETDLLARHRWLVKTGRERLAALEADPEHYDAKVAGWWCWGLCQWIGSGWCSDQKNIDKSRLPLISVSGSGVHRKLPQIGGSGRGVHRKLPQISVSGSGVHRKLPQIGGSGRGACAEHLEAMLSWFRALADRLRNVRVCCGDWTRVCTLGATTTFSSVGVLLDPPYGEGADRDMGCYTVDDKSGKLAGECRDWALRAAMEDPRLRIALCGYEDEHREHMRGWRVVAWKSSGTMQRRATKGQTRSAKNMHKERIWLSPSCAPVLVDGRRIDVEVG